MRDFLGRKIKKPIPRCCRCCAYTPLVCKGTGEDKGTWQVFCGDCGDIMLLRWPTRKSAVEAWNKINKAAKRGTLCRRHKREVRKQRKREKKGR